MKNSRTVKLNLFSPGNLLLILIFLGITACTGGSVPDNEDSGLITVKDTTGVLPAESAEPAQPLSDVEAIQKAYADIITKLEGGVLDSTSFTYSCHGEKNGTVSYFTENKELRLIVHRYNEYDHYSAVDRYFVKDSVLFFAYSRSVTWAFESGPEGSTRDNIKEHRIYLVDGQPMKCLEKKFVIRSQATDNPSSETVPSREVDCSSAEDVGKPYRLLAKFHNNPTAGCLDQEGG